MVNVRESMTDDVIGLLDGMKRRLKLIGIEKFKMTVWIDTLQEDIHTMRFIMELTVPNPVEREFPKSDNGYEIDVSIVDDVTKEIKYLYHDTKLLASELNDERNIVLRYRMGEYNKYSL